MCAGLILQPVTAYAGEVTPEEAVEEVKEEIELLEDEGKEPPIAKVRWISADSVSSDLDAYYLEKTACPVLSIATNSPQLDYYFVEWQEDGKAGWTSYPDDTFFIGSYRVIMSVNVKEEYETLWKLDSDFKLTVDGTQWELYRTIYAENDDIRSLQFASPAVTVVGVPSPGKQINIEKVVATSNIEDLVCENAPIGDPTFDITEGDEAVISGTWMRKVDEGIWEEAEGKFTPGVYRYDAEVDVADEYKITHVLDQYMKLEVNEIQWNRVFSFGGTSGYEFQSPEYVVEGSLIEELPEITGVYISDNQLYWDKLGDWGFYRLEIGDTREVVKYFVPFDLVQFCEFYDVPYGSYTVKITAVDFMDIGGFEHSQTAEVSWVYGKPTPVEKTKIAKLEAASNIAEIAKVGEPIKAPEFTFADYEGIVVTGGRWLKRVNGGERVEVTEETFSPGGYFYEVKISIDDEHKDLYEFDQYMQLYVDGIRCSGMDVATFLSPGVVVVDVENRAVIEEINATSNISEIFVNGGTYKTPTFTCTDGHVTISSMYAEKKDGDNWVNTYAFGPTLGEGEYRVWFILSLTEEYCYTNQISEDTIVMIDGAESSFVSSNMTLEGGIISATYTTGIIEIKGTDPEEPEDPEDIEDGTWYTKWGTTYYETKDGELVTGKQTIDGETYLFNESGALQRNIFYTKDGVTNYFGSDGKMVKGWLERYIGTYYFDENGIMQTGFVDIEEETYYFNEKGHQMKSYWVYEGTKTYYIKADGTMAKSESIRRWGKKYSFDAGGVLMK